jgi:BirA family biotin operon repressor/biotin-[acetyl-CoA-carboxylase] ligase
MPFLANILHYDSLSSTNTEAARLAQRGAAEGLAVVAGEQTAGRGRLQRQWISPASDGLYFSIVLRPRLDLSLWSLLPLMAALAVRDALFESFAIETDIKWPNDILFAGRKLCGILAETIETATGRAAIVGIGINLRTDAFPEELRDVAISIDEAAGHAVERETILQSLVQALAERYEMFQAVGGPEGIIRDWSNSSTYANGKRVSVTSGDETFVGVTRGLESDGALRVETDAGAVRVVHAGDVTSVRPGG